MTHSVSSLVRSHGRILAEKGLAVNKELAEAGIQVYHQALTPPAPDVLAPLNPLSLEFANRRTNTGKSKKDKEIIDPTDEEKKKWAEKGIQLMTTEDAKKHNIGVAAPPPLEQVKKAGNDATVEERQKMIDALQEQNRLAGAAPQQAPPPPPAAAPMPREQRLIRDAPLIKRYYEDLLEKVNKLRADKGRGPLIKNSQDLLFGLCTHHYTDGPQLEQGMAGSALRKPWYDKYYLDAVAHPSREEKQAGDPNATESDDDADVRAAIRLAESQAASRR